MDLAGGQVEHDAGIHLCRYSLGISFSGSHESLSAQGAPHSGWADEGPPSPIAMLALETSAWQASVYIHGASELLCGFCRIWVLRLI